LSKVPVPSGVHETSFCPTNFSCLPLRSVGLDLTDSAGKEVQLGLLRHRTRDLTIYFLGRVFPHRILASRTISPRPIQFLRKNGIVDRRYVGVLLSWGPLWKDLSVHIRPSQFRWRRCIVKGRPRTNGTPVENIASVKYFSQSWQKGGLQSC